MIVGASQEKLNTSTLSIRTVYLDRYKGTDIGTGISLSLHIILWWARIQIEKIQEFYGYCCWRINVMIATHALKKGYYPYLKKDVRKIISKYAYYGVQEK